MEGNHTFIQFCQSFEFSILCIYIYTVSCPYYASCLRAFVHAILAACALVAAGNKCGKLLSQCAHVAASCECVCVVLLRYFAHAFYDVRAERFIVYNCSLHVHHQRVRVTTTTTTTSVVARRVGWLVVFVRFQIVCIRELIAAAVFGALSANSCAFTRNSCLLWAGNIVHCGYNARRGKSGSHKGILTGKAALLTKCVCLHSQVYKTPIVCRLCGR